GARLCFRAVRPPVAAGRSLSRSSLSFSFSDPVELGHKRRRRRFFRVLRLLRFLWPRLVGAGLGRRILTQRREDAEGRRADGGGAEGRKSEGRIFLFLLYRSLSLVPIRRGWATKSAEGAKVGSLGFCVFCAFCGQGWLEPDFGDEF